MNISTPSQPTLGFRNLPSFRMGQLTRANEKLAEAEFQALLGLSLVQVRVLGVVGDRSEMRFSQLCDDLELEKSQASRVVSGLIDRKLVDRLSGQRSRVLILTREGYAVHATIFAAAKDRNERWLSALPAAKRKIFEECLTLLVQSIKTDTATEAQLEVVPHQPQLPPPPLSVLLDQDLARRLHALLGASLREGTGVVAPAASHAGKKRGHA